MQSHTLDVHERVVHEPTTATDAVDVVKRRKPRMDHNDRDT